MSFAKCHSGCGSHGQKFKVLKPFGDGRSPLVAASKPMIHAASAPAPQPLEDCEWCALYYNQYSYTRGLIKPASEFPYDLVKVLACEVPSICFNTCIAVLSTHYPYANESSNLVLGRYYRLIYDCVEAELSTFDYVSIVSTDGPSSSAPHYAVFFVFDIENVSETSISNILDAIHDGLLPSSGYALPEPNVELNIPFNPSVKALAARPRTASQVLKSSLPSEHKDCDCCAAFAPNAPGLKSYVIASGASFAVLSTVGQNDSLDIQIVPATHAASANTPAYVRACELARCILSSALKPQQITQKDSANEAHCSVNYTLTDVTATQYHSILSSFQRLSV